MNVVAQRQYGGTDAHRRRLGGVTRKLQGPLLPDGQRWQEGLRDNRRCPVTLDAQRTYEIKWNAGATDPGENRWVLREAMIGAQAGNLLEGLEAARPPVVGRRANQFSRGQPEGILGAPEDHLSREAAQVVDAVQFCRQIPILDWPARGWRDIEGETRV